ncbi:MAG: hypothetical protein NC355_07000 [Blautia sp.]|nr:hypothetical protein [Blautia sp.]
MKRFYKISCNAPSRPVRLVAAVVLAFGVMVFINGFIGSMGGLPAFIAFAVMFYLLRSVTSAGNRITHELAMTSKRELCYVFVDYCAGYLLLWGIFRLGLMFSRVTGWGNINGASAMEYVRGLLETSILEKWAYFFVGVLMFAFVVSLFPLVVIRRPSTWAAYALLDVAAFALLCEAAGGIARLNIGEKIFSRGVSLIDDLLLCGAMEGYKQVLCLLGIFVFALAAAFFSFFFAVRCYGPVPGRMDVDTSVFVQGEKKRTPAEMRLLGRNLVLAGIGMALLGGILAVIFFGPKEEASLYGKVAEYLTEDAVLGPMVYNGRVYIPVDEELSLYESGVPRGYLARRGEECDSRLYELTVADILYTETDGEAGGHMQVYGADVASFAPVEELEKEQDWRGDEVCLLWDEDWVKESAYSHVPTGYTVCSGSFVEGIEQKFGEVDYKPEDFADYDAYFSLCGYADMEQATTAELVPGHWIGCILVKDNKFYYGNYDNQITGILLQELLDILGGY